MKHLIVLRRLQSKKWNTKTRRQTIHALLRVGIKIAIKKEDMWICYDVKAKNVTTVTDLTQYHVQWAKDANDFIQKIKSPEKLLSGSQILSADELTAIKLKWNSQRLE